ncbi:hypothetical protein P078_0025 [Lactococcus phage P078]|uniref:Uncharacterized protein n=1 Tax=Lactococcus phage P078 TaxID=1476886 RepID=X4YUA1_9CAUD|nr:hypothetical protein GJ21_gp25 [Lactococcus phage P078]AHV82988.1 hypothetical protein P078_0025 [Lactococcus phage P078]
MEHLTKDEINDKLRDIIRSYMVEYYFPGINYHLLIESIIVDLTEEDKLVINNEIYNPIIIIDQNQSYCEDVFRSLNKMDIKDSLPF